MMLKSLKKHNKERYENFFNPKSTGIACPVCGEEVIFIWLGVVFSGLPAQRGIGCTECGWVGSCLS